MTRILKIIGYVAGTLIGLLLLAFIALQFISGEQYKKLIQTGVKSATGRELVIEGDLDVGIGSHLTLKAEKVRFANAEWGSRPEMFTAGRIEGDIPLLPLLKGVLDASLRVDKPDLLLETDEHGAGNWVMGEPKPETGEAGGFPFKPLIRELQIEQGRVAYRSEGEQSMEAVIDLLRLAQEPGADGEPALDTPLKLELAGAYDTIPVALTGQLANLDKLLSNQSANLDLQGKAADAELAINGSLGPLSPTAELDLALKIDARTLSGFAPLTGGKIPDLGPLSAIASLAGAGGDYALSGLEAKLDAEQATALVKGSVASLNNLSGIELEAQADTETLSDLLQQTGLALPYPLPQTVHARARLSGSAKALAIDEFQAEARDEGLEAKISGTAENIIALNGVTGEVSLHVDSLDRLSPYAGRPLPAVGPLEATARIVPGESGFALQDFSAKLESSEVTASVSGSAADLKALEGIELDLQAAVDNLPALLEQAAVELPYPAPGSARVKAHLSGSLKQFAVSDLDARVQDEGVEIEATGRARDVIGLDGIELDATVKADSLARFSAYAGADLPAFGPLSGSVKLTASDGKLALSEVEARLESKQLEATVKGGLADLLAVNGIDLEITANTNALADILQQLNIESPVAPPRSVKATAKVAGSLEQLAVTEFTAEAQDPGLQVTAKGKAENVLQQEGIVADVSLRADQLANFAKYAGTELPALGPLQASARIASKGKSYQLSRIKAQLSDKGMQAKLSGTLADALKLQGIDAKLDLNIDSLSTLNSALVPLVELDLPRTGPLEGQAKVTSKGGIDDAAIDAKVTGTGIHAEARGKVGAVRSKKEEKVEFKLAVDTLDRLGQLIGAEDLTGPQALEVAGTLVTGQETISIEELQARIGNAKATGNVEIDLAKSTRSGRPKILGDIAFGEVSLEDLMPEMFGRSWLPQQAMDPESEDAKALAKEEAAQKEEKKAEAETEEPEKAAEPLFSSKPLPSKSLQTFDADLRVTAKTLEAHEFLLEDLDAILTLQNGVLTLQPFTARVGQGAFDGRVIVDSNKQPPYRKIDFYMEHATFRNFGGTVNIIIDLEGTGNSMSELMAGLGGTVRLLIRNAEIKKSAMTEFGTGLLESIHPFAKERDTTELICAIAHLDIEDGLVNAKHKIAAQTDEISWYGDATIDLKTEKISIKAHPKARKGLISSGGLAKLVYIGGTLTNPQVQLDPKDLALKYGKYTAAIATGGITLLLEIFLNKAQANADICDAIIEKVAKEERKAEKKAAKDERKKKKSESSTEAAAEQQEVIERAPAVKPEPELKGFKNPFYEPRIP